ncbi:DUF6154 family protein [Tepidibacillus marianensis]|uniref:DUF6154 family protein n=1 Tax=Tepidibacillus marianensis TaxID=3131995 RepID=UPI0030D3F697
MRFLNDLYEMYRTHLTGEEEDAVAIVLHILQDHSKEDILNMIQEMEEDEVIQMFAMYLIESLKFKMAQEGVGHQGFKPQPSSNRYH